MKYYFLLTEIVSIWGKPLLLIWYVSHGMLGQARHDGFFGHSSKFEAEISGCTLEIYNSNRLQYIPGSCSKCKLKTKSNRCPDQAKKINGSTHVFLLKYF